MFKNFFLLIYFLIIFLPVSAENINKIIINGNERISDETIKLFGGINIDKNYDAKYLNQIIIDLYDTNYFENISLDINDGTLEISVVENPIIQNLIFEGIKSKKITALLKEVTLSNEKRPYIESEIINDVNNINTQLKNIGYYFATVEPTVNKVGNNLVDLTFNIYLGNKARIKSIKFMGDKRFKDRKLRQVIISEEYQFWKFVSGKKYLNENLINTDKKLLNNYYKNNGYYDVKIQSSFAEFIGDDSFNLVFNIDSGDKFYFNDLLISLPDDYDIINFSELTDLFLDLKGKAYSLNKIDKILKEIDNIAINEQYEFINATVNKNIIDGNKINFTFNITESDKVYVEKINIFGNNITRESVLRNNFIIDEGDPFNEILHTRSINNLKGTGFFKSVTSKTVKGSTDELKVINISVVERPTGEISAGAGVGTNGETIALGVSENNFLGKGIQFSTNLSLSSETVRGSFTVNNPNFNSTDKSLFVSAEVTETDKLKTNGYKTNKQGFTIGTGYEAFKDLTFRPSLSSYFEDLDTDTNASANMKKLQGSYFDTNFAYSLDLDKRNQKYQPTEGYRSVYNQSLPLINETNTFKNKYSFKTYNKLGDMITSAGFYINTSTSLSNNNLRLSDRLFLPSQYLRGFEVGKVGPKDGNDFIGGNYASSINLKTTLPKFLANLQNTDFSLFYDAANVWGVDYFKGDNEGSKIRSSIGLTIDIFTPIGPLNFSFSEALTKADGDKTESFRFNLGTTF
jgi:outer membrane protein insertion porin family|tara:strand:- start:6504 stop:8738 length:2235 start_codon:yes stop_codon:yes gene_type:complete